MSGLVDWLAHREDATSLALFRIAMGVGVWLNVGSTVWSGLVPILWVDREYGGMRSLGGGTWLVDLLGGPSPDVIWSLTVGSLLGGLALIAGVGGRLAALGTLLCTAAVVDVNGHAGGSYDQLLNNGLWLCVLGGGHKTLSVEAWRRTGQWWPQVSVAALPRWLVAYQLVLMYTMTGLQKVSAHWVPGGEVSALYYILQQPSWHRFDMAWVAWVYPITQLATLVTWVFEVFAPLWLVALAWSVPRAAPRTGVAAWFNRWGVRWWFLVTGIVLHISIWVTMEVGPFSPLSIGFYAAMVHPAEWRRLLTSR